MSDEEKQQRMDNFRQWLNPVLLTACGTLIGILGTQILTQQRESKTVLDRLVGSQGTIELRLTTLESRQRDLLLDSRAFQMFQARMEALDKEHDR